MIKYKTLPNGVQTEIDCELKDIDLSMIRKEFFDAATIPEGTWSTGCIITPEMEINLYRESIEQLQADDWDELDDWKNYSNQTHIFTLTFFSGDEQVYWVPFCLNKNGALEPMKHVSKPIKI